MRRLRLRVGGLLRGPLARGRGARRDALRGPVEDTTTEDGKKGDEQGGGAHWERITRAGTVDGVGLVLSCGTQHAPIGATVTQGTPARSGAASSPFR